MDENDKIKNIHDLRYQTLLNYFNILVILIVSSFITVVIGTLDKWNFKLLISWIILIFLSVVLMGLIFHSKFKKIKEEIQ